MTAPLLRYTAARIALFVLCLGLLSVVGVKGLLGVLAAMIVSSIASVVLLKRQRDAIAVVAEARHTARQDKAQQRRARLEES